MKKIIETLKKKWAEYLLEIIVITFGILLAFGLNNWNEGRKNDKLQKEYLTRLVQDFEQDLEDLESVTEAIDFIIVLCVDALAKLGGDTANIRNYDANSTANENVTFSNNLLIHIQSKRQVEIKTFGGQLSFMINQRYFDLTLATYDDLISTGNIEVIDNQELKNSIQTHYAWMKANLDFQEHVIRPLSVDYAYVLKEYGIIPKSTMKLEEIIMLSDGNHKLVTYIHYMLVGNINFLNMTYGDNDSFKQRILNMKSKVEHSLKGM